MTVLQYLVILQLVQLDVSIVMVMADPIAAALTPSLTIRRNGMIPTVMAVAIMLLGTNPMLVRVYLVLHGAITL